MQIGASPDVKEEKKESSDDQLSIQQLRSKVEEIEREIIEQDTLAEAEEKALAQAEVSSQAESQSILTEGMI